MLIANSWILKRLRRNCNEHDQTRRDLPDQLRQKIQQRVRKNSPRPHHPKRHRQPQYRSGRFQGGDRDAPYHEPLRGRHPHPRQGTRRTRTRQRNLYQ